MFYGCQGPWGSNKKTQPMPLRNILGPFGTNTGMQFILLRYVLWTSRFLGYLHKNKVHATEEWSMGLRVPGLLTQYTVSTTEVCSVSLRVPGVIIKEHSPYY